MKNTAERINPDAIAANETGGQQSLQLHLERYHFAGKQLLPGNCVDIACGVGYGCWLLASEYGSQLNHLTGVDIDEESIRFASERYAHPLITFTASDVYKFNSSASLNNIVSLETIEHLPDPRAFINHVGKQLIKGGRFIASVPITPSMDANPFHLHDFTLKSFTRLFQEEGFQLLHYMIQRQPYKVTSVFAGTHERSEGFRKNLIGYYLRNPGKFFVRIGSWIKDGFRNKYVVGVFEKL